MKNTTRMRLISRTPFRYSCYEYPKVILQGKWLDACGIPAEAVVSIFSPRSGTLVLVRYLSGDGDLSLGKLLKEIIVGSTDACCRYMQLQGYWLWRCGFNAGDEVEISCKQNRMLVMRLSRTYRQVEQQRRKLVEAGKKEWMLFAALLAA